MAADRALPEDFHALYDAGVLIRDVGIPHHLRVTAGTEDERPSIASWAARRGG